MDAVIKKMHLPLILGVLFVFFGCREPFTPELKELNESILVVEGFIEVGGGNTSIKLSLASPLYTDLPNLPVPRAIITLLGENGERWELGTDNWGAYVTDAFLPEDEVYTLTIDLSNGQSYVSDKIKPIISPDFDITFTKEDGNVQVYSNTTGNDEAEYFLWQYDETWMYRTPYTSFFNYDKDTKEMVAIPLDQLTNRCYNFDQSRRVILEASSRFENNRIFQKELLTIDSLSEKLGVRYRIKARQYAIDREAYIFWESIRRNSDDIGDIFSPLPSAVSSNIHAIDDPDESVIGYVSAGKSNEKILYINSNDVLPWRTSLKDYFGCVIDTVAPIDYEEIFGLLNFTPLYEYCENLPCGGYFYSTEGCTDCRLRGGVLQKPDYWEDE
ncbi:DUF4249 domain-containing protein [uncultured Cyclobacterium sp.]|uniref:DUF4249 domain-containing protein n=1 Tax=uncultured Cyclobacterium sp. TaxID=453820 RepID=UPI0030EE5964|tara:strand:- start:329196 stop:330353 length:1158 start_codon:yes stop_codon:yes gene_type:complete